MAAGAGGVWIGASRGQNVVRLDPALGSTTDIRLAHNAAEFSASALDPVATGHGAVWVVNANEMIARVDPSGERVVAEVPVGNSPSAIASGAGAVWVTDDSDNTLTRIDPESANAVTATTAVGREPTGVAVGHGAVWVANTQDDTVARVDPENGGVLQTIPVGRRPTGIAAGRGGVWVANSLSGTVSRIDPETDRVDVTVAVGSAPQEVHVDRNGVWVSVQANADPPVAGSGDLPTDVARLLINEDPGPIDPAFFPGAVSYPTCALLYYYPDRPFPAGSRIRPEVAQRPPQISDGGRTYKFRLRSGYRFSPPSDEPVTAAAFERAIERALHPARNSYGQHMLGEIDGAAAYRAGESRRLTGVDAHGRTLVIRLRRPVPNLTYQLAAPYFCAVPPDSPIDSEGVDGLPSAGPYYVASHEPEKSIVLRRNPNYGGPRPQNLSEIQLAIGTSPEHGAEEVEAGRADYVELDPGLAPSAPLEELKQRLAAEYGPESEVARAGHQQLFEEPVPAVFSFIFNVRRDPFAETRLRRAVNFAIDRRALAEVPGVAPPGRPTDQYIPPGMPGFEDAQIYPLGGPDLITARRLAGDKDRKAVLYTCNTPDCTRHAEILRSNLDAIGIDLAVRQFPIGKMFAETRQTNRWDISLWGWAIDYADPFDYINNQFSVDAPRPGGFSDPEMERRMAAAAELRGSARLETYAGLDRDLTEKLAPQATFASAQTTYFISARLGCEIHHPVYGLDLAALCIPGESG
jgi:peptide/nickel transport system substrate-binding protein